MPPASITRPMPDRAREAIFSSLGSYFGTPGELPPVAVADVFAGSGSMGLEALSRSAASCTFFERNATAIATLEGNIALLDAKNRAGIARGDAWRHAQLLSPSIAFGLILLDPPYQDSDDPSAAGSVRRFLRSAGRCPEGGPLVVFHHRAAVAYESFEDEGWDVVLSRHYGTSAILFLSR